MSDYRTVTGFVYAGPFPRKAGSKDVRDYYVSVPGPLVNDKGEVTSVTDTKVRVTVWDSHDTVEITEGAYVAANGKFDIYDGQNKDGDQVRSYSLSANKVVVLGNDVGVYKDRGLDNAKPAPGATRPKREFNDIPGL